MKLLNSTRLTLAAAAVLAGHAIAAAPAGGTPPPPRPAHGGLQVQITTGRISVPQPAAPVANAAATNSGTSNKSQNQPPALPVSALLANQSNRDLDIPFASADAATRQFDFIVLDSNGTQVWDSNADLADGTATDAILHKQQAWKHTVLVPLVLDGTPLATGVYTVEMSVGSAKAIGAVVTFEVVAPEANAGGDSSGATGTGNGGGQLPPPPPGNGSGPGDGGSPGTGGSGSGTGSGTGTGGGQLPPPPPDNGGTGTGTGTGGGSGTGSGGGQLPPPPPNTGGTGSGTGTGTGAGGGQLPPPPPPGGGSGSGSGTAGGGKLPPPPPGGGTSGGAPSGPSAA